MRTFSARETEWLQELDGIELAGFWRRAFAFCIDWFIVIVLMSLVFGLGFGAWMGIRKLEGKPPLPEYITEAANDKTGQKDINIIIGPPHVVTNTHETEFQKLIDDVIDFL